MVTVTVRGNNPTHTAFRSEDEECAAAETLEEQLLTATIVGFLSACAGDVLIASGLLQLELFSKATKIGP